MRLPTSVAVAVTLVLGTLLGKLLLESNPVVTYMCEMSIPEITTANWPGREGRWLPASVAQQFVQGIFVDMSTHDWEKEKGPYVVRSYVRGFTVPIYAHWEFDDSTKRETYIYLMVYDDNLLRFVSPRCVRPGYTYLVMYAWRSPEHRSDLGWQVKSTVPWPDEARTEMPPKMTLAMNDGGFCTLN